MDGISAAASGIAVVSLALQLVETVTAVHAFLRSIEDAPEEIERLARLLEQLHCLLDGVRSVLQSQKLREKEVDLCPATLTALQECSRQMHPLAALIWDAKASLGRRSRIMRKWSALRFSLKKEDVALFEDRMLRAMAILQTAMTLNVMQLSISNARIMSDMHNSAVSIRTDIESTQHVQQNLNASSTTVTPGSFLSPYTRQTLVRRARGFRTVFGSMIYQITSSGVETHQSSIKGGAGPDEERRILLLPSFLSYSIEIHLRSSYGFVSRSLRTFPIVPPYHPAFQMCFDGDLKGLQRLFGTGQASPYSMTTKGIIAGWGLLHEAASASRPEICTFLLGLGVDRNQTTQYGYTPLQRVARLGSARRESPDVTPTIRALLSGPGNELCLADLPGFFQHYFGPPEGIQLLLSQEVAGVQIEDLRASATEALSGALSKFGATRDKEWKLVLRQLIKLGANIHNEHEDHKAYYPDVISTQLNQLLDWCLDPWKSKALIDEWLQILSEEAVDLATYISTELELRTKGPRAIYWCNGHQTKLRQFVFSTTEPVGIHFEWWIDPELPAALVLEEFKNIGLGEHECEDALEEDYWPCGDSWSGCCNRCGTFLWASEPLPKSYRTRLELAEKRFQARERRKAVKYHKIQGFTDRRRMPGAWIE